MATLRRIAVLTLGLFVAADQARAQASPYEWVFQAGRNHLVDSNAQSCDALEGCYTRTGRRCADDPGQICDLQIVPAGRCTSGNLVNGEASCVWPHNAGRCVSNPKVGCLSDLFASNPVLANAVTGPSFMCSGLATNTCDMTIDVFGDAQTAGEIVACQCQGTDAALASFEIPICAGARPVCSDGDAQRDHGGYGWARGDEQIYGPSLGTQMFAKLGPAVNGSGLPSTSPRYPIENPPSLFDPPRDAGTVSRTSTGVIRAPRTTEARSATQLPGGFDVWSQRSFGDSFWSDPSFESAAATGLFPTHDFVLPCDPPVGWSVDDPVAPGVWCSGAAHDGLALLWRRDLTQDELAGNPLCPPNCRTDFDLSTGELEALAAASAQDENAGFQLALQSGQGGQAGSGDSLATRRVTLASWVPAGDLRCRLGGWGNAPGFVGRCSDGPSACVPGDPANGDALCVGQGGICRACNGPINPGNPLGLPLGYSTHGLAALDLVAGQRLGLISDAPVTYFVPLLLVGTSGSATAQFRDVANESGATFDFARLGEVLGDVTPFGAGIGAGGTFADGVVLPIGEPCCAGGVNVSWAAEQPGDAIGPLLRTFDSGPGPDGIPSCFGDNPLATNGGEACNQRLGAGAAGPKTNGAFNTGLDDAPGASSSARFAHRNWPDPVQNQVFAAAVRDATALYPRNVDTLLKLDVSFCPILGAAPYCGFVDTCPEGDVDGDLICGIEDNCPTVANADQADSDADGAGNVCDNCSAISNPRVPAGFLTTNPWATLSGDQRDDDHDGYGNKCDAKFPGVAGALVGAGDLTQIRTSLAEIRTGDTCGTSATRPCAIFDLDEVGALVGASDLARFRQLHGKLPGPKCVLCTGSSAELPCTAGTTGTCGAIP